MQKISPLGALERPPHDTPFIKGSHQIYEMRMWPYLGSKPINEKNKDTFFSSIFKVWESKVSLVLWFVAHEPSYWHFLPSTMVRTPAIKVKINMGFEGTLIHMLEQKQTYPWHPSTPEEQIKHCMKKKLTKRGGITHPKHWSWASVLMHSFCMHAHA